MFSKKAKILMIILFSLSHKNIVLYFLHLNIVILGYFEEKSGLLELLKIQIFAETFCKPRLIYNFNLALSAFLQSFLFLF